MATQLGRNICGRMRSLSGVCLGAVSMARRGTAAVALPPGAARHYSVRGLPALHPEGKIVSLITENLDVTLGVVVTVTANFLYLMDFDGRWARRAAESKLKREKFAERIQAMKCQRLKMEEELLQLKRAKKVAKNGNGI